MDLETMSLIDLAVTAAEVEYGRRLEHVPHGIAFVGHVAAQVKAAKAREWSLKEEDFLRSALGHLSEEAIALQLGRTVTGLHIHWKRDMGLPAPSKAPEVITAQGAANMLGIDAHKIAGWVDAGLIPGRLMPGGRKIRLIGRKVFFRWACSPANWMYFDRRRVKDGKLRRLLQLEAKRWGDEWWTTRQVANYHGVEVSDVKRYIKFGRIHAFQPPVSIGGRHPNRTWGFHYVRKSEATRPGLHFFRRGEDMSTLTPGGRRWIKKALKMGLSCEAIGRTMKRKGPTVNLWVRRFFSKTVLSRGAAARRENGRP